MILASDHDIEITHVDQYRHKFDSAITEYLHQLSLISGWDDCSGTVDSPTGWFARFGRRMLHEDSNGFVSSDKFHTEREAIDQFNTLSDIYNEWEGDE